MMKILFECRYFKIRVREVMILLMILLLLFFGLRSCSHENENREKEKKKEEKIVNICDIAGENINILHALLERADLCSEQWYEDFDDYIVRIEDENSHIQKRKEKAYKELLPLQMKLVKELKQFRKKQDTKQINNLEAAWKAYKEHYDSSCKAKGDV